MKKPNTKYNGPILNQTEDGRIRLTHLITDRDELASVADYVKLYGLIEQAFEHIHLWIDTQPGINHLVTARDTFQNGRRGLCVISVAGGAGMIIDCGLLFDFNEDVEFDEANAAMIDVAEGIAPMLLERMSGGTCPAVCGTEGMW
jgi:hypothetical protein